ncbi:MAG: hypothetical protein ABI635_11080 [Actinomycetota bacterium]
MSLDLDLARWEAGEITPQELELLHPQASIGALISLHERVSTIADEPVPDTEPAMERMLARLPERARRAPRRGSRALLLAAAAVLLTASMAVALPGVRSSVTGFAERVGWIFGDDAVAPPSPASAIIGRGHPRGPGADRSARGREDPTETSGSGSDDSEDGSGSTDDGSGSSEGSGGDGSGDGGSQDQTSDTQTSDGEGSGGDTTSGDTQSTDGDSSDSQSEDS